VASRWTWLTAQISDLEYRIRQQVRTGISCVPREGNCVKYFCT
jgi:hypothetical protein